MARPPRLELLQHGKILCGSVFRLFVETWNWLVGYVDNMKGDVDVNPQSGYISIDRTDPDHPVVRFRADKVAGVTKSSQKILTGWEWDPDHECIVVSSATIDVTNGLITSWKDNKDEQTLTTAISSILPSQSGS